MQNPKSFIIILIHKYIRPKTIYYINIYVILSTNMSLCQCFMFKQLSRLVTTTFYQRQEHIFQSKKIKLNHEKKGKYLAQNP